MEGKTLEEKRAAEKKRKAKEAYRSVLHREVGRVAAMVDADVRKEAMRMWSDIATKSVGVSHPCHVADSWALALMSRFGGIPLSEQKTVDDFEAEAQAILDKRDKG